MRILFVCTGNICRSAAAEYILRQKLEKEKINDVEVASAGIYDLYGASRDRYMSMLLEKHGYSMGGKSVYLTSELAESCDLIIGFSKSHVKRIHELTNDKYKVYLFMEYCFGVNEGVADPHYQSEYIYNNVIDIIEKGCEQIIARIRKNV